MRVPTAADILDLVAKDFEAIDDHLSWTEYAAEIQKVLEKWLLILRGLQSVESRILEVAQSFSSVLSFTAPDIAKRVSPDWASLLASPPQKGGSVTRSKQVRALAISELRRMKKWLPTAHVVAAVRSTAPELSTISSSRVSAALRYGVQRGDLRMRMVENIREWGLGDWDEKR